MKKRLLVVFFVIVTALANAAKPNSVVFWATIVTMPGPSINYEQGLSEQKTAIAYKSQPRKPGGGNRAFRRMHNKIFTVNVFKYNKKIRVNRDKQLKASKRNNKSTRAHKNSKKSKHILLRGSEGNHGFKNKRRW